MDPSRLDALARSLASRRAVLSGLLAAVAVIPSDATEGRRRKQCKAGFTACRGAAGKRHCVNLTTDPHNCGACSHACPAATPVCQNATCQARPCVPDCAGKACGPDGCGGNCGICLSGQTCCSPPGSCVDTRTDPKHCGGCVNHICPASDACLNGHCAQACGPALGCAQGCGCFGRVGAAGQACAVNAFVNCVASPPKTCASDADCGFGDACVNACAAAGIPGVCLTPCQ